MMRRGGWVNSYNIINTDGNRSCFPGKGHARRRRFLRNNIRKGLIESLCNNILGRAVITVRGTPLIIHAACHRRTVLHFSSSGTSDVVTLNSEVLSAYRATR